MLLVVAYRSEQKERAERARKRELGLEDAGSSEPIDMQEASRLGQIAHLTGDPELDSIEIRETDPTRFLPRVKVTRG